MVDIAIRPRMINYHHKNCLFLYFSASNDMTQLLQEFLLLNVPLEYSSRSTSSSDHHQVWFWWEFLRKWLLFVFDECTEKIFQIFCNRFAAFSIANASSLTSCADTNTLHVILANGTYLDPADSVIYVGPQTPRCTAVDKSDDVLDHWFKCHYAGHR